MSRILIINNGEPNVKEFTKPLEILVENESYSFKTINYTDAPELDFRPFSGVIMSGSPQGNDIVEHHLPYFSWIKNTALPIFGICAGHHITGFLYGAELLRNKEPESGAFKVQKIVDDTIFSGMENEFMVQQMHNDSITLPDEFNLLATAKTCKNQLMKHKHKPIYTSQFHPEFLNPEILKNFISICNKSA